MKRPFTEIPDRVSSHVLHGCSGGEGDTVDVACSTLCFARLSLDETFQAIRLMQFSKADLAIHHDGPHLTPAEVIADTTRIAQRLRAANLAFAAFHFDMKNDPGCSDLAGLHAICRLARLLAVPLVTVPAGAKETPPDLEVKRLIRCQQVAAAEGVILSLETHGETLTRTPGMAVELCQNVPGLGLTLDPSHYHISPEGPIEFDAVYPYVCHVRLRDSGAAAEQFQVRIGQGEIEYGRILNQLERYHYDRALTVDVRDVPDNPFPVEPEVRKLKYLLESLI